MNKFSLLSIMLIYSLSTPLLAIWEPLGQGLGGITNSSVDDIEVDSKGNIYACGSFCVAGNDSIKGIAKWDGFQWSSLGEGVNGYVSNIAIDDEDNIYIGGSFSMTGGYETNNIAMWEGESWRALGAGLNDRPEAIELDDRGNLYASGYFTRAGDLDVNYIAMWDGATWNALGNGMRFAAKALAIDHCGVLFVSSAYKDLPSETLSRLSRWDGVTWSSVKGVYDGQILTMEFGNNNILYIGGGFSYIDSLFCSGIATWKSGEYHSLGNGLGYRGTTIGGIISDMAIDKNGTVYVCGGFDRAGTVPCRYLAKWDGSDWGQILGSGSNLYSTSIFLNNDGYLYVGGLFTLVGGYNAKRIARWNSGIGSLEQVASDCATLYPNPTSGEIFINNYEDLGSKLQVFDMAGRRVSRQTLTVGRVDLRGLSPGVYILVFEKSGVETQFKVVKE